MAIRSIPSNRLQRIVRPFLRHFGVHEKQRLIVGTPTKIRRKKRTEKHYLLAKRRRQIAHESRRRNFQGA